MIVFGVYSGCRYEGGNIVAVFSTREKAREYALAVIANEELYSNLNHQASQLDGWGSSQINTWVESQPDCWEEDNGSQMINIIEYSIDELTPPFTKLEEEKARSIEYHNQRMNDLQNGDE